MTNLLTVLPEFDIRPYSHLLPLLERAAVSTADLLTLDALDVAKRAQVPPVEVKKLLDAVQHGISVGLGSDTIAGGNGQSRGGAWARGNVFVCEKRRISTLDDTLDDFLRGGIFPGYLTEIVGESATGKTQFLLTLLLSVQLNMSLGLGKSALYISTEAPLQTTRLHQILNNHPKLSCLPDNEKPSLSRIQSTHIHDLEAQEHILRYQVPVALEKQDIGLLVIDSIAANYRAEFDRSKVSRDAEAFAKRTNQTTQVGQLLRSLAHNYNVAVVVANQVADRFSSTEQSSQDRNGSQASKSAARETQFDHFDLSGTVRTEIAMPLHPVSTDDPLALDHQQRFFTGWGDSPTDFNLKTPSLGLTWTNQLATRLAILKEPVYEGRVDLTGENQSISGWHRTLKIVFSAWCAEDSVQIQIWEGGIQSLKAA